MTTVQRVAAAERQLRLPAIITEGGRRGWLAALVIGAVGAAPVAVLAAFLDRADALALMAVMLGSIGSVYIGFALSDGRQREFIVEYAGAGAFIALAVAGLALDEPVLIAAGLVAHGIWDVIHHERGVHTKVPRWYAPFCLGFDAVAGVYVLVRFA
jgi:hypothetical protein